MSRAPRTTGSDLLRALKKAGFTLERTRGSHHFLVHQDGRRTVIPVHSSEIIGPGLLRKILRDCQMETSELETLLQG